MNEQEREFSALKLSLEFGYTIAIPIVVLALLGRFLDNKLDTSPWLLITGVVLSMIISSIGLVIKFNKVLKQINTSDTPQKEEEKNKEGQTDKSA